MNFQGSWGTAKSTRSNSKSHPGRAQNKNSGETRGVCKPARGKHGTDKATSTRVLLFPNRRCSSTGSVWNTQALHSLQCLGITNLSLLRTNCSCLLLDWIRCVLSEPSPRSSASAGRENSAGRQRCQPRRARGVQLEAHRGSSGQ